MLGIGTGIMNAAALGGGGGGGSFDPTSLNLLAAYEIWDNTSLHNGYRNIVNSYSTMRPRPDETKTSGVYQVGTIIDKASLPGWDGTQTFDEWKAAATPLIDTTFDSATGWTTPSGWAITGGELVATSASTTATFAPGITAGEYYWVEIEFSSVTSGQFNLKCGHASVTIVTVQTPTVATWRGMIKAHTTGTDVFGIGGASSTFSVTSLKLYECPGRHLFAAPNDQATYQETGGGIPFIRTANGDWFMSDKDRLTVSGTQVSMAVMFQANTASMENYGGLVGIGDNGTSGDSILFGNSSGASVFTPNILTDDGTTTTDEYTRGSTTTALHIHEFDWNGATAFTVYEDGSSVATGTPATTIDMTTQTATNQISLCTTPGASDSFNSWGDVYALYLYEDPRSSSLYDHINTNTGSQI